MRLLIGILFLITQSVSAQVRYELNDADLVASVGAFELPASTVEILWHKVNHPQKPVSRIQVLQGLIETRLLAEYARQTLPVEKLNEESRVGFLQEVAIEDEIVSILRKYYDKALVDSIKALPGGQLNSLVQFDLMDSASVQKQLTLEKPLAYVLSEKQQKLAADTNIATFTFPGSVPQMISLWDIYKRQNVQGRIAIHQGDIQHLKQQLQLRIGSLYVMAWVQQSSKLSVPAIKALTQLISDKHTKQSYLEAAGLYVDIHDDNPAARERAKAVTKQEIHEYYLKHQNDFRLVEKAKARHIRVTDQDLADKIHDEIEKGMDFSDAVKKYSIAEDKNLALPGDLGWISRKDRKKAWLNALVLIQPEGKASRPFRSPQGQGKEVYFEIVLVDQRVEGVLPETDLTVSYEASRSIAKSRIQADFFTLKDQLLKDVDININQKLVKR